MYPLVVCGVCGWPGRPGAWGVILVPKKCHELFEWFLNAFSKYGTLWFDFIKGSTSHKNYMYYDEQNLQSVSQIWTR